MLLGVGPLTHFSHLIVVVYIAPFGLAILIIFTCLFTVYGLKLIRCLDIDGSYRINIYCLVRV